MSKEKKIFLCKFILFTIFACVLPFVFIGWRYSLFSKVDKISLSGWGLVALVILFAFVFYVVKTLKKSLLLQKKWSLPMQVTNGVIKVLLPLIALYLLVSALQSSIELFKQSLVFTILSEAIAIPLNPLPKLEIESKVEGEEKTMDTFFSKAKQWWKGKEE